MSDDTPEFSRETGLFVCSGDDGEELRVHRREGGRYFFHRWRMSPGDFGQEPRYISPQAFGLTAGEIYDAAEALRRESDARKTTGEPPPGTKRAGGRSSPR